MSAGKVYRIAVVGAASLAGKELSDALSDSSFAASSFTLLDEERAAGQMAAAGDEVSFIQKINTGSFEGMDFVFFADDAEVAKSYWQSARKAGATVIDLTSALAGVEDALVLSPWVKTAKAEIGLETSVVVPAHPAAVMLALLTTRLAKFKVTELAATVLEPASQYGRLAMDELHQQTVSLLSFQTLPRERYDAQVAFNLLRSLGDQAKIKLAETERRIVADYATLAGDAPKLAMQLIHAPVFHGYVASVFVDVGQPISREAFELALVGDHVDLVAAESDPPSNLSAAGQDEIMVLVESAVADGQASTRFKVLLAADNLKLAALNAIACARELAQLRPLGKVQ